MTRRNLTKGATAPSPLQQGVKDAFAILRDAHEEPRRYRGKVLVIPLRLLVTGGPAPLSRERMRLLLELKRHGGYESVSELAEAVGRPRSRVSQDLEVLTKMALVEDERQGRARRIRSGAAKIVIPIE